MSDLNGLSDSELSQRLKNSDQNVFKYLFYFYYKNLYSFFWLRTRSEDTSKDFIQEVFTKLWQNRINIKPELSLKSYLFRISHNILIDYYRKKKTETLPEGDIHASQESIYHAEYYELEEKIKTELNKLPADIRSVFLMSRMDGLKYTEIAETLNISVKTVESRMSKALKILRTALKPLLILIICAVRSNFVIRILKNLIG